MKKYYCIFALQILTLVAASPVQAQLFQNNNTSCEDKVVVGAFEDPPASDSGNPFNSFSIACGKLNDDSAFGFADFSDCMTQRDGLPFNDVANLPASSPVTNTLLVNTGAHGNNCLNLGGQAQFEDSRSLLNRGFNPGIDGTIRMGTIALGNLNNDGLDDIAMINFSPNIDPQILDLSNIQSVINPGVDGVFDTPDFIPASANFPNTNHIGFGATLYGGFFIENKIRGSERTMVLDNCDLDPASEALVVGIATSELETPLTDDIVLMVSNNAGNGLQDINSDIFIQSHSSLSKVGATLTQGDFNGDNIIDVITAINNDNDRVDEPEDSLILCVGNGNCGFDCTQVANHLSLEASCDFDCDPFPNAIVSGDFNGDGLQDVAVGEIGFGRVRYLLNNGSDLSTWDQAAVNFALNGDVPKPIVLQKGRFSTEGIRNNIDELAITVPRFQSDELGNFTLPQDTSTLEIITTDLQGGFEPPVSLQFNPDLGSSISAAGVEVKDFDHCGGDDALAIAQTQPAPDDETARASLFLNVNETPVVTLSPDLEGDIGEAIPLAATCDDPTFDRRSFSWTILSSPEGSLPTLEVAEGELTQGDQIDAANNFVGDQPGEYTVEFTCTDFCEAQQKASLKIVILEAPPPPPPPPPPPLPNTQGGCLASLQGDSTASSAWTSLLILIPLFAMSLYRRRRKNV